MRSAVAIVALVLGGALVGCAEGQPAVDPTGTGGGTGGEAVGTGGGQAAGATGATGGAPGTGGVATGGQLGTGGIAATGGVPGTGGVASATGGTGGVPTCESLGWSPGDAQLCGKSKSGYACAACDLPAAPKAGAEPDCTSATAVQGATVLCTLCGSCQ